MGEVGFRCLEASVELSDDLFLPLRESHRLFFAAPLICDHPRSAWGTFTPIDLLVVLGALMDLSLGTQGGRPIRIFPFPGGPPFSPNISVIRVS
jgi:hypothetical protein